MVYTTSMLLEKYKDYGNGYTKIQRDCKNGKLIKLMRGLYEDNPATPPYLCSGYIYGPSYVSFEYVLSKHGLIPEYVPNVTCASYKKNKVKCYDTAIGSFIYRDVPARVFTLATIPLLENGYSCIIATPEKALCDKLYSIQQAHSQAEFNELLFNDMRIEKEELDRLDWKIIEEIGPMYHRQNLSHLLKYHNAGRK